MAHEYFPLTKEEALQRGYRRKDEDKADLPASDYSIPDDISEVTDEILSQVLQCEISKKSYRLTPQELQFYRKMKLPVPRIHPEQRHKNRMASRNPRRLRDRKCAKCGIDIKTSYAPERPEMVYCEACYNREIYG